MNKKTEKHLAKLVAAKYKLDGSQSPRWHRTNDCMSMDKLHEVKEGQTKDISAERASAPFEAVSPESPCSKCGASNQEDFLCCRSCREVILHGQEHFYAGDGEHESDTFCLCERCDEFGPPSEEEIPFARSFGLESTTEWQGLPGQDQNGRFQKPAPQVVVRLAAR